MPQRTGFNNTSNSGPTSPITGDTKHQVVNFNEVRAQKLEEKRRKTERIFFKNLVSVYSMISKDTMIPIELIEVSEDGCSFQIPYDASKPWPANLDELPIRFYFSQDSFMEVRAIIQNARPSIENGARYTRFGCEIDKEGPSYNAYVGFVNFLKLYAENEHKDKGDTKIFYL